MVGLFRMAKPELIRGFLARNTSASLTNRTAMDAWMHFLTANNGGGGSLEDRERNWLHSLGASGEQLGELWSSYLSSKGFTAGSLEDRLRAFMIGGTLTFAEVSFLQAAASTADTNSYTFSAQNLGTAAADRYIIVGPTARKATGSTTITGITVGGIAATITRQRTHSASNVNVAGIALALVPTGTSGDVVVTFGATMVRSSIGLWRATGINPTAFDSDDSIAAAPTVNLDTPANGFAIGVAGTAANTTATWTGLTEKFDAVAEASLCYTGASDSFVSANTGRTMTCTFGANTESVGVFASWG